MHPGVHTELETRDGRPVVVKRGQDAVAQERLHREAVRLAEARHPGVVEVVTPPTEDEPLVLAWAGTQTLATARPDVLTATALLAEVATTLADLHQRGMVHGRLDPTHVVIDSAGRARLCGWAGPDPDDPEPPPTAADDVAATGRLIEELVGTGSEPEPIPDHRWGRRPWTGFQARAVQTLADQATAPEVERRPTARALADALGELIPDRRPAPTPGPATILGMRIHTEGSDEPPTERRRTRGGEDPSPARRSRSLRRPRIEWSPGLRAALVLVGLLGAGLAALALVPAGPSTPEASGPGSNPEQALPTTRVPATPTTTPPVPTTDPSCPPPGTGVAVDVDGDGCLEAATVAGGRITVGTTTYQLGQVDDDVVLGDWDCDGSATPALLRPSSGEVFVFARWPDRDEPITLTATTSVPADARLAPAADAACGAIAVDLADGTRVEVAVLEPEAPR